MGCTELLVLVLEYTGYRWVVVFCNFSRGQLQRSQYQSVCTIDNIVLKMTLRLVQSIKRLESCTKYRVYSPRKKFWTKIRYTTLVQKGLND
jgi:hypothetical protein